MSYDEIHRRLASLGTPQRKVVNERYFKMAPGQYAERDKFIGLSVPATRVVAKEFKALPIKELTKLLKSEWHEERQLALIILVDQYKRGDKVTRDTIHALYLANMKYVNNWDLVDCSAEHIVGPHLAPGKRALLVRLAKSKDLWERRIAMLSTFAYIKAGEFGDALRIAELLVDDDEDLIRKAVGWMLREIGERDRAVEEAFLRKHAYHMPRTMLRYAVEKFPAALRTKYMNAASQAT